MTRASPRPSIASTRAMELLTAEPDMGTAAVLAQLQSESLTCARDTIARAASKLPPGAKAAHRLMETRALLRRLAGASEVEMLTPSQLAAVAEKLDVHRQQTARAWLVGVGPSVRARWSAATISRNDAHSGCIPATAGLR